MPIVLKHLWWYCWPPCKAHQHYQQAGHIVEQPLEPAQHAGQAVNMMPQHQVSNFHLLEQRLAKNQLFRNYVSVLFLVSKQWNRNQVFFETLFRNKESKQILKTETKKSHAFDFTEFNCFASLFRNKTVIQLFLGFVSNLWPNSNEASKKFSLKFSDYKPGVLRPSTGGAVESAPRVPATVVSVSLASTPIATVPCSLLLAVFSVAPNEPQSTRSESKAKRARCLPITGAQVWGAGSTFHTIQV